MCSVTVMDFRDTSRRAVSANRTDAAGLDTAFFEHVWTIHYTSSLQQGVSAKSTPDVIYAFSGNTVAVKIEDYCDSVNVWTIHYTSSL